MEAEAKDNRVVFTNLEEGDAVLLIYKIQNYQFGAMSSYFWGKQAFYSYYPALDTKFSLLISPDIKFNHIMTNSDLKPEIKKLDDYEMYTWQRKDQPKLKYEEFSPAPSTFTEVLNYSSIPSWSVIANWYLDIYKTKAKGFYEVKDAVAELFPDNKKLTEKEIITKIYNYIVSNIRYSFVSFRQSGVVPQKASTTLNTRIGDCKDLSTLFVAMCREKGIKADLVLVSTNDNGKNDLPLPSTDFNHAIATVTADGQKYYVELTNDLLPFGSVHGRLIGALGLEIKENSNDGLVIINPPDRMKNSIKRTINVSFENDRMKSEISTVRYGGQTTEIRFTYKNKSLEDQRKDMVNAISSDYPGTKLLDLSFGPELNNTDDSLTYQYSFYVDNIFSKIANFSSFKVPYSDFLYGLATLSDEQRKTPYNIASVYDFDCNESFLNISVPPGKMFAEIPQDVSIDNEFGNYKLSFKLQGKILSINRTLSIKKDIAKAGSEFERFRDFLIEVNKYDTKQLAFTDEVKTGKATKGKK